MCGRYCGWESAIIVMGWAAADPSVMQKWELTKGTPGE